MVRPKGASCGRVPRRGRTGGPSSNCRRCRSARTARSPSLRQSSAWDGLAARTPTCRTTRRQPGHPARRALHPLADLRRHPPLPCTRRSCSDPGAFRPTRAGSARVGSRGPNRGQLRCGRSCSAGGVGWVGDCAKIECTRRGKGVKTGGILAHAPAPVVIAGTWRTP